jgi:hypothetical protein
MSAFTVELKNEPGELAQLGEMMAANGVNLILCATTHGGTGTVAFVADDEAAARTVLDGAGVDYTQREALTVRMENVPGAGASAFRRLANASVNMDVFLPIRVSDEQLFAVICVDDIDAASAALGDQVVHK